MTKTVCPPGVWTALPAAEEHVETRGMGGYISTAGAALPLEDAVSISSNASMTFAVGTALHFQPAQPVSEVKVWTSAPVEAFG